MAVRRIRAHRHLSELQSEASDVLEARVRWAFKGATLRLTTMFPINSGLCNQHISLVNLLSIALTARVDVVLLPVALQRLKFQVVEERWPTATADTLWDVDSITRFMSSHGIAVEMRQDEVIDPQAVILPRNHYYVGQKEVAQAALNLHDDVRTHLHQLLPARLLELATLGGNVTLHIPNLFLGLRTMGSTVSAAVMRAAPFAPMLQTVTDQVIRNMLQRTGATSFNGVHLRVEQDVVGDDALDSDRKPVSLRLHEYLQALNSSQLDPTLPLYVASGIFLEAEGKRAIGYKAAIAWLEKEVVGRLAASIVHKGMFLPEGTKLQVEQLAVVDFLVLKQASKLVGYGGSSFSYLLREARAMDKTDRASTQLIRCCFPGFELGLAFPF